MKSNNIILAHIMPTKVKELANQAVVLPASQKLQQNDKKISWEARQKRLLELKSLRKLLHEAHPVVFDYNEPLPLAIGIHKEIKATFPQFSQKLIREFLGRWVKDPRYLSAIVKMPSRVDLQEKVTEQVKNQEKIHASTFFTN